MLQGEQDAAVNKPGGPSGSKINQTHGWPYNCTFSAMIDDWRAQWSAATFGEVSSDFPFGCVLYLEPVFVEKMFRQVSN